MKHHVSLVENTVLHEIYSTRHVSCVIVISSLDTRMNIDFSIGRSIIPDVATQTDTRKDDMML